MNLFTNLISNQDVIFRFAAIILLALYGLFALIVAIQISDLNKLLNQTGSSILITILSVVNVLASIALLFFAVLSL
jgi:hypothetical protein